MVCAILSVRNVADCAATRRGRRVHLRQGYGGQGAPVPTKKITRIPVGEFPRDVPRQKCGWIFAGARGSMIWCQDSGATGAGIDFCELEDESSSF